MKYYGEYNVIKSRGKILSPGNYLTRKVEIYDADTIVYSAELSIVRVFADSKYIIEGYTEETPNTLQIDTPIIIKS